MYNGPAGINLLPSELYIIYMALLPLAGSDAIEIRSRIYAFLRERDYPGLCDDLDG